MRGFGQIHFPIDFSEACRVIEPFVKSMTRMFGARVTLIHALRVPGGSFPGLEADYPIATHMGAMRNDVEKRLVEFFDLPFLPCLKGCKPWSS